MDLAVSKLYIKTASSSHLSEGIRIFLNASDKWTPKTPSSQLSKRIQIFRIGADNCKIACISLGLKSSAPFSTVRLFPTKIQKNRQSPSFILVQDNQRGDDARHPAAEREQKHDEHRAAAAVDDLEAGHGGSRLSSK